MKNLAYTVETDKAFDEVSRLVEKLSPERGFRVLAVHDVQKTLSEKGLEIMPLKIFEICNAGLAHKAIDSDVNVAMFMPCKIVIRSEGDKTSVTLVRPSMIAKMLPDSGLGDLAAEVEDKLRGILDEIG
ncbi:MAG: DUF302 domain-containing protein [Candidatus Zixiibacteriota bacterium]|nr:MAG: DUF302 domain-containing protein [candidate division Zixibacteria bacterium]